LKGRGVETLAIEWIVKNLSDAGEGVIVVPDGLLTQLSIINFLKKECIINAIISLPKNTFYATSKKTYILIFNKKTGQTIQSLPVFTYIVSEIGESRDTKRFVKDIQGNNIRNDFTECVSTYMQFKSGISNFDSLRVKIYEWDIFDSLQTWLIDKNLSEDEKTKIGLSSPKNRISENDFLGHLTKLDKEIQHFINNGKDRSLEKVKYITKPLCDLFTFPKIKGLTEKFIRNNSGVIPVYGGRQNEVPVGMIADNLPDIKYFSNCLAWNREGSVGYVFYHNHKFTTNDHHRPMLLKDTYVGKIDLIYIKYILEQILLSSDSFEWSKTASKEKISKIEVSIPVDSKGDFDVDMQKRIAKRLERYDKIKKSLFIKISDIASMQLDF
jgi:hypothetical protein